MSPKTITGDLGLLMALRVQGLASAERAAAAVGIGSSKAEERLRELAEAGLVRMKRTGRGGFLLTPEGTERLTDLLSEEGLQNDDQMLAGYGRFMRSNKAVIEACSDWQVRRKAGAEIANDHSDPDYDHAVIERLSGIHDAVRFCLSHLSKRAPRFAPYAVRLDDCLKRILAGDRQAFTAPMAESYHTIWFELHQDLLLTLGLEREE